MQRALKLTLVLGLLAATALQAQKPKKIPLSARSKGSETAPVVVYEMSDFQCPYCARHALKTAPILDSLFVKTGKIRFVFINFPLSQHLNAQPAAAFSLCAAKQGKFWEAHDLLFATQQTWTPLKNPGPFFLSLADSLKLPKDEIASCVQAPEILDQVKEDFENSVKSGAERTPTFYVEGALIEGALPVDMFRKVLDSIYTAKTKKIEAVAPEPRDHGSMSRLLHSETEHPGHADAQHSILDVLVRRVRNAGEALHPTN